MVRPEKRLSVSLAGELRTRSTASRRQRRKLLLIHDLREAKVGKQQVRVFVFRSVEQVLGLDVCMVASGVENKYRSGVARARREQLEISISVQASKDQQKTHHGARCRASAGTRLRS